MSEIKGLPVVDVPTIVATLPLSQKKIKYRPFINKEKKVLLLSKDSDDWDSTLETLRSVILSCTFGTVDIKNIPVADAGWLFVQLRIQSIGTSIQFATECQNEACKEMINLNYDLNTIKIDTTNWNPTLMVTDSIGITFNAPTFDDLKFATGDDANPEMFIASLISGIFDESEVYDISAYSKQQLIDWMDQFTDEQLKKIHDHLKEMPTLRQDIDYKCPKCGHEHHIHLEGLSDFF